MLIIQNNTFYDGDNCLGDILEIRIISSQTIMSLALIRPNSVALYVFNIVKSPRQYKLEVKVFSDLDHFFGITMYRPVWIWCDNNNLKAEISNYSRLQKDKK